MIFLSKHISSVLVPTVKKKKKKKKKGFFFLLLHRVCSLPAFGWHKKALRTLPCQKSPKIVAKEVPTKLLYLDFP